jgi:hypothetical protein
MNASTASLGALQLHQACYRRLHRYKYQLMKPYVHDVRIPGHAVDTDYLRLEEDGTLEIKKTYAWDGPSGPTRQTLDFMRGSLIHDAVYQLIRMEVVPASYKDHADRLLQRICREDGMSWFRAWYVYLAVRWFGHSSVRPGTQEPIEVICVPRR